MANPFNSRNQPRDGLPSYDAAVANDRPTPSPGFQNRNPFVSVTDPAGRPGAADSRDHGLHRSDSRASDRSHIDTYKADRLMDDDKLRELDDEMRELPEGWVRCFDPKTHHHFYVDTATRRSIWIHPYDDPEFLANLPDTHPANPNSREAREARQQAEDEALAWRLHQEELQAAGRDGDGAPMGSGGGGGGGGWGGNDKGRVVGGAGDGKADYGRGSAPVRKPSPPHDYWEEDEGSSAGFHSGGGGGGGRGGGSHGHAYESEPTPQEGRPWSSYKNDAGQGSNKHRNVFQRGKDKLIGSKEERDQHKEERRQEKEREKERLRKQQEDYLKRRQELIDKQINDGTIGGGVYNDDPYGYAPPSMPFNRTYNNSYGYGYGGGYGRRYGYGPYGGGFGGYSPYGYGGYGGYGGLGYGGYGGLGYGGLGYGGLGLGAGLLGGALLTDALIF